MKKYEQLARGECRLCGEPCTKQTPGATVVINPPKWEGVYHRECAPAGLDPFLDSLQKPQCCELCKPAALERGHGLDTCRLKFCSCHTKPKNELGEHSCPFACHGCDMLDCIHCKAFHTKPKEDVMRQLECKHAWFDWCMKCELIRGGHKPSPAVAEIEELPEIVPSPDNKLLPPWPFATQVRDAVNEDRRKLNEVIKALNAKK